MAVIIQADPYQTLSRKIGYSVGLEFVLERVRQLTALYVAHKGISLTTFRELVKEGYGRDKSPNDAAVHFANFYSTLNLVRLFGRELEPMYQLDSLSILRRLLSDDNKYTQAMKVVLCHSIIEADADVFLNALHADFDAERMKTLLGLMVDAKCQRLGAVFRSPQLFEKVRSIVGIRNQAGPQGNKERSGGMSGTEPFARRTAPLSALRRTAPLSPAPSLSLEASGFGVTDDYVDKARKTRRGWAEDLGLFANDSVTLQGSALLRHIRGTVVSLDPSDSAMLFWGYTSDLARIRVRPSELVTPPCEAWDLLVSVAGAYSSDADAGVRNEVTSTETITLLEHVFSLYKEARAGKGLIRNSLPLYVAEPVLAAWCVAEGKTMPALYAILEAEFKKPKRRVQRMIIRGTAGALFFME